MIVLKTPIIHDEYTDTAIKLFDIPKIDNSVVEIKNDLKIPNEHWKIGVIVGSSGSGKSTIIDHLSGGIKNIEWDDKLSVISNFKSLSPEEATNLLCSVGLSSVPVWFRPYHCLSTGEKFRADIARSIADTQDGIIYIDEFTSVVNRDVAKATSVSLQRYIRQSNKQIILSTCHYDVLDWINPDWIYNTDTHKTDYPRGCLRQPRIELQLFRCKYEAWDLFKHHHYLTSSINKSSKCFIATLNNVPVGFIAILSSPNRDYKNGWRVTRLVVLPDYQGLGIGKKILNHLGSLILNNKDARLYLRSVHPKIASHCLNNSQWKETSTSRKKRPLLRCEKQYRDFLDKNGGTMYIEENMRVAYSFRFFGEPANDEDAKVFWDKV